MRKYSIQDIRFSPIEYRPASKALTRIVSVTVKINYQLGEVPSEAEKQDVVLDGDAAAMLYNFDQFQAQYTSANAAQKSASYDYLIITSGTLSTSSALTALVQYRSAQGHSVKVVTTDWIVTNVGGIDIQEKIRNYLKTNYLSWGIKNVALIGSPLSIPMRNCVWDPPTDPVIPTDYYYSELTANWSTTADYCGVIDWYPECMWAEFQSMMPLIY